MLRTQTFQSQLNKEASALSLHFWYWRIYRCPTEVKSTPTRLQRKKASSYAFPIALNIRHFLCLRQLKLIEILSFERLIWVSAFFIKSPRHHFCKFLVLSQYFFNNLVDPTYRFISQFFCKKKAVLGNSTEI